MAAATFYETAAMDEGDPPSWIAEASSIAAAAPQNKVPQNRYFYTDQKKCVSFDAKSGHKLVKIVELKKRIFDFYSNFLGAIFLRNCHIFQFRYVTTLPLFFYVPYNKTHMLSHSILKDIDMVSHQPKFEIDK